MDSMLKAKNNFLSLVGGGVFCVACLTGVAVSGQNSADSVLPDNPLPAKTPQNARERILVNKTDSVAPLISPSAALENLKLHYALRWNFGAKRQRGWYLYVSLIQHTIGTESGAQTIEFARAVAVWQQKEGIYPTGIIDSETFSRLIELWQSRRLNSSVYAAPEDLLTAPIADFFDPTREIDLLKIERETYKAYKRMVFAAANELKLKTRKNGELLPDEKFLRIVSGFRSREYQNKLRAASPRSGRAGLAVNSPHFTGRALDIYVGGEPTITKDLNRAAQVRTPVYRWLVKNAARFGFYPYFYEPWHWEYVPQNSKPSGTNLLLIQK